ncbi:MAG: hypothetical protein EZS28_020177 [Streblomastix strix]|uniref:Uncharacterized protein n=1 Tax=Streblomastix strix TaxID=222440 RepID=A0A5J4VPP3_9EUKA|nr:MAG: hypothetical protein EZS28_020177 [Streblomastix strix]
MAFSEPIFEEFELDEEAYDYITCVEGVAYIGCTDDGCNDGYDFDDSKGGGGIGFDVLFDYQPYTELDGIIDDGEGMNLFDGSIQGADIYFLNYGNQGG